VEITLTPATVPVLEVGGTATLTATVTGGAAGASRGVTWRSTDPAIASVSSAGVVTGIGAGNTTILAIAEADTSRRATAIVAVRAPRVVGLTLSPATVTLEAGARSTVTATVEVAGSSNRRARFRSSDPAVFTVTSADGVSAQLTGVAPGSAQLLVAAELDSARVAVAAVRVSGRPIARLELAPATDSVAVARTLALSAVARDADGAPVTGAPVRWRTSDAAIADISPSGVVTGIAVGVVTISAQVPRSEVDSTPVTATRRVRVASGFTLALAPRAIALRPGGVDTLRGTIGGSSPLFDRLLLWRTSDAARVAVDTGGRLAAVSPGTALIVARMRADTAVRDSVPVTVVDPCVAPLVSVVPFETVGSQLVRQSCDWGVSAFGDASVAERLRLTVATPATLAVTLTGRSRFLFAAPIGGGTPITSATDRVAADTGGIAILAVALRAGTYDFVVAMRRDEVAPFTFLAAGNPGPEEVCLADGVRALPGTSLVVGIGIDCRTPRQEVRLLEPVPAGATLTARGSTAAERVVLELCRVAAGGGCGDVVATATASAAGQAAELTWRNPGESTAVVLRVRGVTDPGFAPVSLVIAPLAP
jgi:uncharacterized protein YjdB